MLLELRDLDAHYGRAQVLFGVSLGVGEGEVVALMGRNGAGKSSTLKTVMGLLPPSRGSIRFAGTEIAGTPPHEVAASGLGWVPEDRRIFTDLTVTENLEVGRRAARPGIAPWTHERLFALFPNLAAMRDRPGGRMSGGEQQMLTIARTLMGNPQCLLLDEPSEGLAPVIVDQMVAAIAAIKREGLAILLCEQNLAFATKVADRAAIIERGMIRYEASMSEMISNEDARKYYLSI
jgi:branched-chain amino acid transport system ATP-binding protein